MMEIRPTYQILKKSVLIYNSDKMRSTKRVENILFIVYEIYVNFVMPYLGFGFGETNIFATTLATDIASSLNGTGLWSPLLILLYSSI